MKALIGKYRSTAELLKKCKELDNLIEKRFVFKNQLEIDEYKAYNTKVLFEHMLQKNSDIQKP